MVLFSPSKTTQDEVGSHPAPGLSRRSTWAGLGIVALLLGLGWFLFWPAPTADQLWERSRAEVASKQFDRALKTLNQVAKLRPPTVADIVTRSEAEDGRKNTDAAVAVLGQIPDTDPMAATAHLLAGQLELRRQRLVPAEAQLRQAVRLDPGKIQALRELVYVYGMQLRRPELNRTFQALARRVVLEPSEVYLWTLSRGVSWEPDEITEYLTRCLAADPSDRLSRLGLAENLRQQNKMADAEKTLEPLPASDPDARATRVRIAIDRGDDAAVDALLADAPTDHLDLALLRGRLALARGDAPAAVSAFRTAYAIDPTTREVNQGLGRALTLAGDPAAAAPFLDILPRFDALEVLLQRAALARNRDNPAMFRDLGAACMAVGRKPEAASWYRLAIRADPTDIQAQRGFAESNPPAHPEG